MASTYYDYDQEWDPTYWVDDDGGYARAAGIPVDIIVLLLAALVALLLILGVITLVGQNPAPSVPFEQVAPVPAAPPATADITVPNTQPQQRSTERQARPVEVLPLGPDSFVLPYDDYILTQGPHGMSYGHYAIDIAAGKDAPIKSPISGAVTERYTDPIGNPFLVLENEYYEVTLLHGVYTVNVGDTVKLGDIIGTESNLGNTRDMSGRSCRNRDCGYHTHLNVYDKKLRQNVNPLDLVTP